MTTTNHVLSAVRFAVNNPRVTLTAVARKFSIDVSALRRAMRREGHPPREATGRPRSKT